MSTFDDVGYFSIKCLHCGVEIQKRQGVPLSEFKRRKFCNQHCSATHNNLKITENKKKIQFYCHCERCGETILLSRTPAGYVQFSKFCKNCIYDKSSVSKSTKESLISRSCGYQSYRTAVRKNAAKVFDKSGTKKECIICGYDKHIQVCHIKSVSDFSGDSPVTEINRIENLVAMCPNHHWEYDNGLIDLSKFNSREGRIELPG